MAMDLLQNGKPPVHLYRHDLESFFWVLTYFVATHDPKNHTIGRINQWTDRNLVSVGKAKADFLQEPPTQDVILSRMHPEYETFWSDSLYDLGRVFNDIYSRYRNAKDRRVDYVDAKLKGKKLREERAAHELKIIATERNTRIDYKKFSSFLL